MLKVCEAEQGLRPTENTELIKESPSEKMFFEFLLSELNKVSKTYVALETISLHSFLNFLEKIREIKVANQLTKSFISSKLKECAEHHLRFVLLENYAVMNYCGFTKILKKHDKLTGFATREKYMIKMVNDQAFASHSKVQLATKLILKEFHNLQSIRLVEQKHKTINIEQMHPIGIRNLNSQGTNIDVSRLTGLVSLLEKHKDLSLVTKRARETVKISEGTKKLKRKQSS